MTALALAAVVCCAMICVTVAWCVHARQSMVARLCTAKATAAADRADAAIEALKDVNKRFEAHEAQLADLARTAETLTARAVFGGGR